MYHSKIICFVQYELGKLDRREHIESKCKEFRENGTKFREQTIVYLVTIQKICMGYVRLSLRIHQIKFSHGNDLKY